MRTNARSDDMLMVYVVAAVGACLMAWMFWSSYHVEITYYSLRWTWELLGLVDWPWMPAAISSWRAHAASLAANPGVVTPGQLLAAMDTAGYLFVVIPLFFTGRAVLAATRHRANLTRRRIDAKNLPWIMSTHAPAVIPALYYGDSKTQLLNVDPPEHRSARNPEEWVQEHGLLVDGKLDRAKARALLIADLGKSIDRFDDLLPHERALFAVFGARLLSDGKDVARAQTILDDLNRSCHTGTHEGKRGYPDFRLVDAAFAKYSAHPDAAGWLEKHRYSRTLLHAMHKALLPAALPSSHFRWLKGIDRGLWYALNTTGRKVAFIESAATYTQTLWESFAHDCGYQLTEPYVDDAINGVESYLIKIGLIDRLQLKD